jgi:hypothetical protein
LKIGNYPKWVSFQAVSERTADKERSALDTLRTASVFAHECRQVLEEIVIVAFDQRLSTRDIAF